MEDAEVYDFRSPAAPSQQPVAKYDLSKYILDYSSQIQEPVPILMQGDNLVISRGNLSVIAGAPKSRKSMFVSAMVASYFGNSTFGLTSCIKGGKCLLFDTESSESHTLKQIKRIYKLLDWTKPNSNLIVFHLRECSIEERFGIIKQAIDFYRPEWAVCDGLLDLILRANSEEESNVLILELMRITSVYDCHITSILHTSKNDTSKMLGFLGSYAQRKAETVFQLSKDGNETKVIPAETRNAPFEEFSFIIDEFGIPVYCGKVENVSPEEKKIYAKKKFFTKLLAPDKVLDYDILTKEYSEVAGCVERTAKRHISDICNLGFIKKEKGGYKLTGLD